MKPTTVVWLIVFIAISLVALYFILGNPLPTREDLSRYQPLWWVGDHFFGIVTNISPDQYFSVTDRSGTTKQFYIEKNTRFMGFGSSGLKMGGYVKVTYKTTKQILLAKAVWELPLPKEFQPSPAPPKGKPEAKPAPAQKPSAPAKETVPAPQGAKTM